MKLPQRLDIICQRVFLYSGLTPLKICLQYQRVMEFIEWKRQNGIDDYGRTPEDREREERWQRLVRIP